MKVAPMASRFSSGAVTPASLSTKSFDASRATSGTLYLPQNGATTSPSRPTNRRRPREAADHVAIWTEVDL
jgi:hypothetical protein